LLLAEATEAFIADRIHRLQVKFFAWLTLAADVYDVACQPMHENSLRLKKHHTVICTAVSSNLKNYKESFFTLQSIPINQQIKSIEITHQLIKTP
jgi:hypothetical protein